MPAPGASRIVAVAGGTGLLGRLTVSALLGRGALARRLSRGSQGSSQGHFACDLATGSGLDVALAGADTAIWCAHDRDAKSNDGLWIRQFIAACTAAGVQHLVYTGIAGIESAVVSPYYAGKLREEAIILQSGLPHTILRATQFHTLVQSLLESCDDGRIVHAPHRLMLRPVAPEAVAERLAGLVFELPQGRADDIAGPRDCSIADLARAWGVARGLRREVASVEAAPERWALLEKLTHGPAQRLGPDFATWLTQREGQAGSSS